MLIDTMFARDMYQVNEINDDLLIAYLNTLLIFTALFFLVSPHCMSSVIVVRVLHR